jgi:DNA-damage-inducible protein J
MAKTAHINTRIEPDLKSKAENIFSALGVSASDAIAMFYRQVIYRRGIPFDVCIPNETTVAALKELDAGGGEIVDASTEAAFADILRER